MKSFFTFMIRQGPVTNHYVEFENDEISTGRDKMLAEFGTHWAFEYDEEQEPQLQEAGMTKISVEEAHDLLDSHSQE